MSQTADIAQSMLDHALEVIQEPPRVFVGWGEPAAPIPTAECDNEQLTVHVVRLRPKLFNDTQQITTRTGMLSWVAELAWVLWRCVPTGDDSNPEPSAAELATAYAELTDEAEAISRHFSRLFFGDDWPELEACKDVAFGNTEPIAPSGGVAGVRGMVIVQL